MSILDELNATTNADDERYQVALPDFYGPMDLLLDLIEREELEITRISLAQVTDQFLDYVTTLKEINADNLTDFLVVASKLLVLKSKMLLPKPPPGIIEDEEAETDDLVQQLRDYKRFKTLAQELHSIEALGRRNFVRLTSPLKIEPKLQPGEGNILTLLAAVRQALTIKPEQPNVTTVVSRQEITIGQQINHIRARLQEHQQLSFEDLLTEARTRVEVIVTFLAVLELLKRRLVEVEQTANFGQIILFRLEEAISYEEDWSSLENMTELS
jgi:segregation and condensation protein A